MYKKKIYIVSPIYVPVKYWSCPVLKVSRAWAGHLHCMWRSGSDEGGGWYQSRPSHGPDREIRINIRLNISISHQVHHHHVERTIPNHYDFYMSQCLRIWVNVDLQSGFSPVCQWLCWSSKAQSPLPHSRSTLLWGKVYNTRNLPLLAYQSWSSSQSAVHKHFEKLRLTSLKKK